MSTLIYIIETPSMEEALRTAKELEDTAGIKPEIVRDLGISYRYESDGVNAVLDGDKSITEYLIENSIK